MYYFFIILVAEFQYFKPMNYKAISVSRASYEAPELCIVPLSGDATVCQTSLGGGEIQPGTGDNWGTF